MKDELEEIVVPDFESEKKYNPKRAKTKEKKLGLMITSIVLFSIALAFTAITIFYLFSIFKENTDASSFVAFIVFVFTLGWVTYLPALVCSIIGIVTSSFALRSDSKAIKVTSIIFLILNILILVGLVILGFLMILIPGLFNG